MQVQAGALELLSERLSDVAEKTRRQLTPTIVQVVDRIRAVFAVTQEAVARPALKAIAAISDTLCAGEEGSLTNTMPLVLNAVRQQTLRMSAFHALLSLSSKLGPRAITFLKELVKECVVRAREAVLAGTGNYLSMTRVVSRLTQDD